MTDHNDDNTWKPPAPPTASYEVQRAYQAMDRDVTIFQTVFQATKGVFKPRTDDPKTWYGRVFRFIGLLCIYLVMAMMILVGVQDFLKEIRPK
ncbi:MAG TPA: hypothetical protein VKB90_07490 [Candidatus Acidoferrum sp.]|nr:hypothetical protein [Candidatus Acidoferrum sp.]